MAGDKDNTVPLAISEATYHLESKIKGLTEHRELPGRGHSLTIDHGWQEVAEISALCVERFVDPTV